jgi:iron complex outermembrane receptor protein
MAKSKMSRILRLLSLSSGVAAIIAGAPAMAQGRAASTQADAIDAQDIIVTATKREQNLSQIPAAISAVTSDLIDRKAIVSLRDINGAVPGLQISNAIADVQITIRGVGHAIYSPFAENSIALHLDGVYLSRPSEAQGAFFDVSRVEVLRGPQGTLYGRNASGGAINVVSNEPTGVMEGFATATYGNYDYVSLEAAVGGPIAGDTLMARVGGFYHRRDGFGTNIATNDPVDDLNEYGGKLTIVAEPGDSFKLTLRGDWYHADDGFGGFHYAGAVRRPAPGITTLPIMLGGVPARNIRDTNYGRPNTRYADNIGLSGTIDYDLGGGFSLKSVTGYRRAISRYSTDADGTNLPIADPFRDRVKSKQFSEELQLSVRSGPVYALLGGYYFHELIKSDFFIGSYLSGGVPQLGIPPIFPAPFGVINQIGRGTTDAKAIFANVDWDVTPRFHLGGGLRYSVETKGNEGYQISLFPNFAAYPATGYVTVDDSRKSRALTPKLTAKYDFTDDVNAYASVSRGFKSGEWIAGTTQYALPERLWAYEAGVKGSFFDRKLRASFGAFYYDYSNLQVQRVVGNIALIENVPKATIYGLEAEGTWRLPAGFSLDGNVTYLHTRNGGFITGDPNIPGRPTVDLKGRRLSLAPTIALNAGIEKRFNLGANLEGTLRFDIQHMSDTYLSIFQSKEADFRPANTILNASYKQQLTQRLSVLLWGKNLTNKTVVLNSQAFPFVNLIAPTPGGPPFGSASADLVNLNDPRTFGMTIRFDW